MEVIITKTITQNLKSRIVKELELPILLFQIYVQQNIRPWIIVFLNNTDPSNHIIVVWDSKIYSNNRNAVVGIFPSIQPMP